MFGDTIVLGPNTFTKINQDRYGAEYLFKAAGFNLVANIRHSKRKVGSNSFDRHNVEITMTVYATATVPERVSKTYLVWEHPIEENPTEIGIVKDLASFLTANTNANILRVKNWES